MNKDKVKRLPDQVSLPSTRPAMTNTVGRSMVEMLGVLAIIGVLSAGALAGYSKAMFRHRVNQSIDIFSQVLQRVAELEEKGIGEGVEIGANGNGVVTDSIKYGIFPDCKETIDAFGQSACKLPIGSFFMYLGEFSGIIDGSLQVHFMDSRSCIAFSSVDWVNAIPVDWWHENGNLVIGGKIIYSPSNNVNNMTMDKIVEACKECDNGSCYFDLMPHSDY